MSYTPPKRKKWSKTVRLRVKQKFGGRCAYCGCVLGDRFALDHHLPIGVYGERADTEDNLFPSCIQCNHYKGEESIETMRRLIERTYDNLVAKSLTGRIAAAYGLLARKEIKFYFEEFSSMNLTNHPCDRHSCPENVGGQCFGGGCKRNPIKETEKESEEDNQ